MGVILYEMLTQRVPFEAETPLATLMKHVNDPLPLPRSVEPTIPIELEGVILQAMAKQPEDRYTDVSAMVTGLTAALRAAHIELPDRLPRAQSFTTPAAPSESVQVVSGAARQELTDTSTTEADTDITLQEQMAAAQRVVRTDDPRREGLRTRPRPDIARGIFMAIGIIALGNLVAVTISSLLRNWAIFEIGWPMQLLLAGGALFALMGALETIWLSIPAGLITANGALFAYCALTGNWHHWIYLWIVEPWVAALTVIVSIQLARVPHEARAISRLLGWSIGVAAILAAIAVQGASLVLDVVRRLIG
jgi:hypothetical protein